MSETSRSDTRCLGRSRFVLAAGLGVALAATNCGGSDSATPNPNDGRPTLEGCPFSPVTGEPKDNPICLDDRIGVFVAPVGDDANDGTKKSPIRSIRKAQEKLGLRGRIYLCEGSYAENLVIRENVSLFGGFDCNSWAYTGAPASIVGNSAAPPLTIANAQVDIIADVIVAAKDAVDPGASSVAVLVRDSAPIVFRRVTFEAGAGKNGDDAAGPPQSNYSGSALTGHPASGTTGATPVDCQCPLFGNSHGGSGGNSSPDQQGTDGLSDPMPAPVGAQDGKAGAKQTDPLICPSGHAGAPGAHGVGGSAASDLGTLSDTGWVPSPGQDGRPGNPGGGGGGGAGGSYYENGAFQPMGGGGGACGGCGGAGGQSGRGGGSSFALLVANTRVTIESSTLASSNAGNGGKGSSGESGSRGGSGGSSRACKGGDGGTGGHGGGGAGGTGGVSACIGFIGNQPVSRNVQMSVGAKGSMGDGGLATTGGDTPGQPGKPGKDGVAQEIIYLGD